MSYKKSQLKIMQPNKITVTAHWDAEAEVWTATSDDLPGLVIEAATPDELKSELDEMVPALMELNGVDAADARTRPQARELALAYA